LLSVWDQIRVELDQKHPDIAPYFKDLTPSLLSDSPDTFLLEFRNDFCCRQMKSARKQEAFLAVVREVSRAPWKLRMESAENGHPLAGIPLSGSLKTPSVTPPLGLPESARGSSLKEPPKAAPQPGQEGISKSPIVKKSLDLFNGRLV